MQNYEFYYDKGQLGKLFGMSKKCVDNGITQSLLQGKKIRMVRPPSPKGLGHPRYWVADVIKAWEYTDPLQMP